MTQHFAVHGYIDRFHQKRIRKHGTRALLLGDLYPDPDSIELFAQPAFKVELTVEISEAEVEGLWQE